MDYNYILFLLHHPLKIKRKRVQEEHPMLSIVKEYYSKRNLPLDIWYYSVLEPLYREVELCSLLPTTAKWEDPKRPITRQSYSK